MDKEQIMEQLTEEQRERIEKLDTILSDPENQKKISAMTSPDEAFAFYEENGFVLTEEQKKMIIEKAEELAERSKDGELTEDELEAVAGGWSWTGFAECGIFGGIMGGLAGFFAAGLIASNPVGWAIGIGALVLGGGAAVTGGLIGK